MIRFLTAGESHGESLTGIIEGVPAIIYIYDIDFINKGIKEKTEKDLANLENENRN